MSSNTAQVGLSGPGNETIESNPTDTSTLNESRDVSSELETDQPNVVGKIRRVQAKLFSPTTRLDFAVFFVAWACIIASMVILIVYWPKIVDDGIEPALAVCSLPISH